MRIKNWSGIFLAPPLLFSSLTGAAAANNDFLTSTHLIPDHMRRAMIIEVAGADETDKATPEQLKDAGTNMVPSEDLKKAKPILQPSTKPAAQEPEKVMPAAPEPIPVKAMEPEQQPMVQEEPQPEPMKSDAPMPEPFKMAGPYLRIDGGYTLNSDPDGTQAAGPLRSLKTDNGSVWGIGLGYQFDKNLRGDITASYRPDVDVTSTTSAGNTASTEVSSATVMLNGYWDFADLGELTPYVGAGIGFSHLSTSDQTTTGGIATEIGETAENFAWSLTVGAAYEIFENTSLDINYQYINLGDFKQAVSTSYDSLDAHEFRGGLRVNF